MALKRESPEDIKFCELCGEYQVLPEDEAVAGPMNLVYHRICPICADEHKPDLVEMTKRWILEKRTSEEEMVPDAN